MARLQEEVRARGTELQAAFQELRQVLLGLLTSTALRRFVINTVLVCAFASFTCYLSIPAYAAFYHFYLPDQIVTVPLHLQYGYGANPFAVASLLPTHVKNTQSYDVDISLTLPHSPENLERGNFMVGLLLLGDGKEVPTEIPHGERVSTFIVPPPDVASFLASKKILHSVTRPTRLPYRSSLASKASLLLRLPYNAIWPGSETNTIVVRMAERLRFGRGTPVPGSLLVEIQAGQALQVYDAEVTLTAQLKGLRYFMYQYRVTAFMLFTGMFWVTAMMAFAFWFALPEELLPTGKVLGLPGKGPADEDDNDGKGKGPMVKEGEGELSDTERTFPSTSKQPPLRFEPQIKREDGEGSVSDIPALNPGVEADDEDEEDGRARDSGIGTSLSDNRSREGTRTSARGSL